MLASRRNRKKIVCIAPKAFGADQSSTLGRSTKRVLQVVDPTLAFRIERVVNNKLTLENFVVR
jgi:hypothetical protein